MVTTTVSGGQVGRSLPRLEGARQGHRPRRIHSHMRLPGMLHGKIFRSTVAHGRIKSIDTSAARRVPGVYRVVHQRRHPQSHPRSLLRAGLPRPADPGHRQGALRRRAGRGRARRPIRMSPRRRRSRSSPNTRSCRRFLTRSRRLNITGVRARRAQAGRHLRRSQASQGPQGHQRRARFPGCGAATSTRRLRRPRTCSNTPSAPRRCCTCRSSRSSRSPRRRDDSVTIHTASQSPSFVRIEIARLLGWPENRVRIKVPFLGGGFGGKLYIKLEALVDRAVAACAAAGEDRADDGRAVLHDHQARRARFASKAGSTRTAASSRANARCGGTAAPMPISARA